MSEGNGIVETSDGFMGVLTSNVTAVLPPYITNLASAPPSTRADSSKLPTSP